MKTHAMLIDYKYCTGCYSCEIACRNEHDYPSDVWGIKVYEYGPINQEGKWEWDYHPFPTDLCDLCEERREKGERAACAHHCLADCIKIVPIEDISKEMKEAGDKVVTFIP